jgi:SAM-dependent methyltransferase
MNSEPRELQHISLRQGRQEAHLRENLYDVLAKVVYDCVLSIEGCRVLDVGVGRGELLQRLKEQGYVTYGMDLEPDCVHAASQFGDCRQGIIEDIKRVFPGMDFDVIVCSHVLEHLDSPCLALKTFASLGASGYVFAVPNPLRPIRLLRALLKSRTADHPEHVYAWGHPEFVSLLKRCGFTVDAWYIDRVTINPFRGRLGNALTRVLGPFETKLLPRFLPLLSSSLIVRCHIDTEG